MEIRNLGEGVYVFGVMIAVGMTKNYWLLLFLILPLLTWLTTDNKVRKKNNELEFKKSELEIEKLKEEIRILKLHKK